VIAALSLLAWTTTASAECGWLLWETEIWTNCKDGELCRDWEKNVRIAEFTRRHSAFERMAECENEHTRSSQITGSGKPHVVKRTVDGVYRDIVIINSFSCWPAVVDIRK
jgi:hypothetical protein